MRKWLAKFLPRQWSVRDLLAFTTAAAVFLVVVQRPAYPNRWWAVSANGISAAAACLIVIGLLTEARVCWKGRRTADHDAHVVLIFRAIFATLAAIVGIGGLAIANSNELEKLFPTEWMDFRALIPLLGPALGILVGTAASARPVRRFDRGIHLLGWVAVLAWVAIAVETRGMIYSLALIATNSVLAAQPTMRHGVLIAVIPPDNAAFDRYIEVAAVASLIWLGCFATGVQSVRATSRARRCLLLVVFHALALCLATLIGWWWRFGQESISPFLVGQTGSFTAWLIAAYPLTLFAAFFALRRAVEASPKELTASAVPDNDAGFYHRQWLVVALWLAQPLGLPVMQFLATPAGWREVFSWEYVALQMALDPQMLLGLAVLAALLAAWKHKRRGSPCYLPLAVAVPRDTLYTSLWTSVVLLVLAIPMAGWCGMAIGLALRY